MPCTTILVGKKASYDGSTIVARNEDAPGGKFEPKRFVAREAPKAGDVYRSVISHLEIELPEGGVPPCPPPPSARALGRPPAPTRATWA